MKILNIIIGIACVIFTSLFSNAQAEGGVVQITVSASVYAEVPCTMNNGRDISVEFKDALISEINGSNNKVYIANNLTCTGTSALKMRFLGQQASFDLDSLKTSNNNLGIKLYAGIAELPINTWFNFDANRRPILFAALTKNPSATLTEGTFTGTATLQIEYQ